MNSTIGDIRAYVIETVGVGGHYNSREPGHWLVDAPHANPLSVYAHGETIGAGDDSDAILSSVICLTENHCRLMAKLLSATGQVGVSISAATRSR